MKSTTVLLALAAAASCAGAPLHAQRTQPLEGLDAYVERSMRDWNVPGVAIAVVHDDSVVLAKGYGVRELGSRGRVDENTLFGIMSTTKAFTSAAMAMLVEEGKVKWDDPVAEHLPEFQLPDPWVSRQFTIRDLLSHRSGLERGDFLWFGSGYDRDQVVRQLRHLEPVGPFRTEYGYSNNMYIAAGQLIARRSGMTWDQYVRRRIFQPLGMSSSNTSVVELRDAGNVALPHEEIDGRVRPIPFRSLDNEAPGGAINSSAREMAQWIRMQLGKGSYRGTKLVGWDALRETHVPHTVVPIPEGAERTNPGVHFMTYAMGWAVQDYRGTVLVQHSGSIDGLRARVALLPKENVGVVILTNLGAWNSLADALRNRILDAYLGAPPTDWSAVYLRSARRDRAAADSAERALVAARVRGTSPSLPLAGYAGAYRNRAYGDAHVRMENGRLVAQIGPSIAGDLEHWHYNTFRATWRNPYLGWSLVTFDLDAAGKVKMLRNASWWPDYSRVEP